MCSSKRTVASGKWQVASPRRTVRGACPRYIVRAMGTTLLFLSLVACHSSLLFGSISLVQITGAGGTTNVTFSSSVSANDLIVVGITQATVNTATVSSVTDTLSTSYAKAVRTAQTNNAMTEEIWYGVATAGGSSVKVTVAWSGASSGNIIIAEYTGNATSSVLDGATGTASGSKSTSLNSGNITTTNASDLLFGLGDYNSTSTTLTAGSGYTMEKTLAVTTSVGAEDQVVSATGTYSASMTASGSAQFNIMQIAAFKATAPPPPTCGGSSAIALLGVGCR
jgi:hypothetical protein